VPNQAACPEPPAGAPERVVSGAINMMRGGFQQLMQAIQDCEKPVIVDGW
jgi:hypothetical protein